MDTEQKVVISQYRQIAIDIAKSIVNGKYAKGEKIFGRSVLASYYKVSPETIRKAIHLLKDVEVLEIEKGSGVEIISAENAKDFINRCEGVENLTTIKKEVEQWAKAQVSQSSIILKKIQLLLNEMERASMANPLNPYQVKITEECTVIGKTVDELQFWHRTGGTVVAVRRDNNLILSPGPYASVCVNDEILFVGDQASYTATMKLLYE